MKKKNKVSFLWFYFILFFIFFLLFSFCDLLFFLYVNLYLLTEHMHCFFFLKHYVYIHNFHLVSVSLSFSSTFISFFLDQTDALSCVILDYLCPSSLTIHMFRLSSIVFLRFVLITIFLNQADALSTFYSYPPFLTKHMLCLPFIIFTHIYHSSVKKQMQCLSLIFNILFISHL